MKEEVTEIQKIEQTMKSLEILLEKIKNPYIRIFYENELELLKKRLIELKIN